MIIPSSRLCLQAGLDNLGQFMGFATERLTTSAPEMAAMALSAKLELVLEELLVNVINHAYKGAEGDVEVVCLECDTEAEPFRFCMEIRDQGPPFDPSAKESPDTAASMDERSIGGLGIHLVREMTEDFTYRREGNCNITHFCLRHP